MARRQLPPFIQYVYAQIMPTPGAMAYGYESEMLAWRPMIGPAIGVRQQFASIASMPLAIQGSQASWLTGLTGVTHGQSILQPLSNPYAASS